MNVHLSSWNDSGALAFVDGTRVRIKRNTTAVRWICAEHGEGSENHCEHTAALAASPADPEKRNQA